MFERDQSACSFATPPVSHGFKRRASMSDTHLALFISCLQQALNQRLRFCERRRISFDDQHPGHRQLCHHAFRSSFKRRPAQHLVGPVNGCSEPVLRQPEIELKTLELTGPLRKLCLLHQRTSSLQILGRRLDLACCQLNTSRDQISGDQRPYVAAQIGVLQPP